MTRSDGLVLVTGAGGWIGHLVVTHLRALGVNVVCASRETADAELTTAAAAATVVVHAGSGSSNARSEFIDGGMGQAVAVARGCTKVENVVVFLSSAKVYGWAADGDIHGRVCDEISTCLGNDNFSMAKRLTENILTRSAHRCAVLRISNVYGDGVPAKYAIGTMLATAISDRHVMLDCTGASRRDFVHIDDVVSVVQRITLDALREQLPDHLTFNVASGQLATMADVANIIAEATGAEVETRGRPPTSSPALSNHRLIEAGYAKRFIDPLAGIRTMMATWKEHPWKPV